MRKSNRPEEDDAVANMFGTLLLVWLGLMVFVIALYVLERVLFGPSKEKHD